MTIAGSVDWLKEWAWLLVVMPALYVASDFTEDVLLARLMTSPETITVDLVGFAKAVTQFKIAAASLAIVQLVAVSILGGWSYISVPSPH